MWVAVKAPSLDASKTRLEELLSGLKYMSLIPPQSHKACQVTSYVFFPRTFIFQISLRFVPSPNNLQISSISSFILDQLPLYLQCKVI